MGKNGERRPNVPLNFEFTHPVWSKQLNAYLRSDADGIIRLGDLQEITEVSCKTNSVSWELSSHDQHLYPDVIHGTVDEPVQLPFTRTDDLFIRSVALFSCSPGTEGRYYIDDHTNKIRISNGILSVPGLDTGFYDLHIGGDTIVKIIIANTNPSQPKIKGLEDFVLGSNLILETLDSIRHPLYLSPIPQHDDNLISSIGIRVHNWTPATRVCVVATKFLPHKSLFENMSVTTMERPWSMNRAERTPTTYRTGRVLGEEYQYILNRKAQSKRWVGNLLTKPSVLLTPWSIGETTMSKEVMADQNLANVQSRSSALGAAPAQALGRGVSALGRGGAMRHRRILPPGQPPLLSFLANPSVVLANLIPDQQTGEIQIPFAELKEGNFVQIFITDGAQAIHSSFAIKQLAKADYQKRDLRFKSSLDHTKHYIGERTGISLDFKLGANDATTTTELQSVTLPSNTISSSSVKVINSVSQVYDLMMTLLEAEHDKQTLRKFGFIVDWHRFPTATKNEKYSKWNCHELNLVLYKKDRPYFDSVVAPFIKNKLIKSFIDDYLIGASLEKYTEFKEFKLLTCLEKCLLAHRIPRWKPCVSQWIRSRVRNTKAASDIKLFRTVMSSATIDEVRPSSPNPENKADEDLVDYDEADDDFEMVE
ncbi:hypothetical protein BGZ65_008540, partial [Modicella reniformis]